MIASCTASAKMDIFSHTHLPYSCNVASDNLLLRHYHAFPPCLLHVSWIALKQAEVKIGSNTRCRFRPRVLMPPAFAAEKDLVHPVRDRH